MLATERASPAPLQLRHHTRQRAGPGPECPRGLRCAPRRPPAAALARRARAPGGGGGKGRLQRQRRWSRWSWAGADRHVLDAGRHRAVAGRRGPTRLSRARAAVTCRGAPTSPPQISPRALQRAAQCACAARALSGPLQQQGSRSDRVFLSVRDSRRNSCCAPRVYRLSGWCRPR